jgi:hypothetical protein
MKQTRIVAAASALLIVTALASGTGAQEPKKKPKARAFDIVEASIDQIHAAYRSGQLTTRRLVQEYLDRIAAFDKQGPTITPLSP